MKIILSIVSSFVLAANVSAVQYTLQNIDGASVTGGITDNAGDLLTDGTGVVSIGTFTSDSDVISSISVAELLTHYTEFDSDSFGSAFVVDGVVQRVLVGDNVFGQIYTFIGNGVDLASSTEILVYKNTGFTFVQDPSLPADPNLILNNQSDVLIGGFGEASSDFGAGEIANFNLVSVPEPSSSALLALAGVGFVLRRRR